MENEQYRTGRAEEPKKTNAAPIPEDNTPEDSTPGDPAGEGEPQDPGQRLMRLVFRVSEDDYTAFSCFLSGEMFRARRRASLTGGITSLAFAVALPVIKYFIPTPITASFWIVLAFLIPCGLYSLFYYPFFYKIVIRRKSKRTYAKNEYLRNTITYILYENLLKEITTLGEYDMPWGRVAIFHETREQFIMQFSRLAGLFIPKDNITEKDEERLRDALRRIQEKHGIPMRVAGNQ